MLLSSAPEVFKSFNVDIALIRSHSTYVSNVLFNVMP